MSTGTVNAPIPPPTQPLAGGSSGPVQGAESVLQSLAAVIGLVYATGFLIIFTFQWRLGIRDIGDFFRAKYIYVGALYWLIPSTILFPVLALVGLNRRYEAKYPTLLKRIKHPPLVRTTSVIGSLQFVLLLSLALLVSSPGFGSDRSYYILANAVMTVGGFYLANRFARRVRDDRHRTKTRWGRRLARIAAFRLGPWRIRSKRFGPYHNRDFFLVRCLLLVCLSAIGAVCIAPVFYDIAAMAWSAKVSIVIAGTAIYAAIRLRLAMDGQTADDKRALWWIGGTLISACYFFSVIGFAYTVYPLIPADRAGGDFRRTPKLVLFFPKETQVSPDLIAEVTETQIRTKPARIVEQTQDWLYLALSEDNEDDWKSNVWDIHLFAVRRDVVDSINIILPDHEERHPSAQKPSPKTAPFPPL